MRVFMSSFFKIPGKIVNVIKTGEKGYRMAMFRADRLPENLLNAGFLDRNIFVKGFLPFLPIQSYLPLVLKGQVLNGPRGPSLQIISYSPDSSKAANVSAFVFAIVGDRVVADAIASAWAKNVFEDVFSLKGSDLFAYGEIPENIAQKWDKVRAACILQRFLDSPHSNEVVLDKIWRFFGTNALPVVTANPYMLLALPEFTIEKTRDIVKKNRMSLRRSSELQGLLLYNLKKNHDDGHTYISEDVLVSKTAKDVADSDDDVSKALYSLVDLGLVYRDLPSSDYLRDDTQEDSPKIFMSSMFQCERKIAECLRERKSVVFEPLPVPTVDHGVTLGEDQEKALKMFSREGTMILTGFPGSGKTTVIRAFLKSLKPGSFRLLAPTGMAARRLSDLTGHLATTIHSALNYDGVTFHNSYLGYSTIIVDEMSMVDVELFYHLISAVPPETRLILVGDDAQLPSVGPGKVFSDLIESKIIPTVRLTQIYRQGESSEIIRGSHSIFQGTVPDLRSDMSASFLRIPCDPSKALDLICRFAKKLRDEGKRTFQVLAPTYKGPVGIDTINEALQETLNPHGDPVRFGFLNARIGDTLIFTQNDTEKRFYNGDFCRLLSVVSGNAILEMVGQGKTITLPSSEIPSVAMLGYCISVHRSQGNEFDVVILPLFPSYGRMLERTLLYTAVTRGKQKVILLGDGEAFRKATINKTSHMRRTLLSREILNPSV